MKGAARLYRIFAMSPIQAMKYLLIFSIVIQNVFMASALNEHLIDADIAYTSPEKERKHKILIL
jgi:hypothetical protein